MFCNVATSVGLSVNVETSTATGICRGPVCGSACCQKCHHRGSSIGIEPHHFLCTHVDQLNYHAGARSRERGDNALGCIVASRAGANRQPVLTGKDAALAGQQLLRLRNLGLNFGLCRRLAHALDLMGNANRAVFGGVATSTMRHPGPGRRGSLKGRLNPTFIVVAIDQQQPVSEAWETRRPVEISFSVYTNDCWVSGCRAGPLGHRY